MAGISLTLFSAFAMQESPNRFELSKYKSLSIGLPEGQKRFADQSSNTSTAAELNKRLRTAPAQKAIASYRALRDGWDGPSSVAPSQDALSAAIAFVESISPRSPLPNTTVSGDGEVNLSWRDDDKFVDISFYGSTATVFARIGGELFKIRSLQYFYELPSSVVSSLLAA